MTYLNKKTEIEYIPKYQNGNRLYT